MKRLLTATTALALVGGAAFAEITISVDAKLGFHYNSVPTDDDNPSVSVGEPDSSKSRHSFTHEMGVDFTGSGTTDGGLTFGAKAGFDTGDDTVNTGTVFVSGAFGTITIGDNDPADLLAGDIADVGLDGVGVDDVVEDIRGTTDSQFRYDQSVGNIALALSAGTGTAGEVRYRWPARKSNTYAVGMSIKAASATVGIGYDSTKTINVGFGYGTGQIAANALYAKKDIALVHIGTDLSGDADDGTYDVGFSGIGLDVSYTVGASTLTVVYAKTTLSNVQPIFANGANISSSVNANFKGVGIGFSHDLGGGAKLVAGFAQVPRVSVADLNRGRVYNAANIGQTLDFDNSGSGTPDDGDRFDLTVKKKVASVGLSFSF